MKRRFGFSEPTDAGKDPSAAVSRSKCVEIDSVLGFEPDELRNVSAD